MGASHSALLAACEGGNARALRAAILARNIRVDGVLDSRGRTPLFEAAAAGRPDLCEVLVSTGHADVNAVADDGSTPVMEATRAGHTGVVALLCGLGADVAVADSGGTTPIHLASALPSPDTLRVLLAHGAPAMVTNSARETPLHIAAAAGAAANVAVLIEAGVSVGALDRHGRSAFELARGPLAAAVLTLLRSACALTQVRRGGRGPVSSTAPGFPTCTTASTRLSLTSAPSPATRPQRPSPPQLLNTHTLL